MVHFNGEKYIVLCPSMFVTVDSKINPLAFESKFTTTDKLGFDIKISHKKTKSYIEHALGMILLFINC